MPEIAIIGAGPAGSAAALLLARRGWSVTLIEQQRFPRDKVCGECLSALGVDVLDRLGMVPNLLARGAVWLHGAVIHAAGGEAAAAPLPRPMLGVSRYLLDELLLEAARAAGVHIRQPARCEALHADIGGITLRVRDPERNRVETLARPLVILADGKAALAGKPPAGTGDIGIKSHWAEVAGPRDAIELFSCAGCYGGLAAIEGGRWNTAFSVPAARVREHRGNLQSLFVQLRSENRSLGERFALARRIGPWLASPLPRFPVSRKWLPGVIPIGNAAAALEPIGGEGMGLALRSAELAASSLHEAHETRRPWTAAPLRRAYAKLWNLRRLTCRMAALVVSSTNAANVAVECMQSSGPLAIAAMRGLGKDHGARPLADS